MLLTFTLVTTLSSIYTFTFTLSTNSMQTFSKAVTAREVFRAYLTVFQSDNYYVYLFNQSNCTLYTQRLTITYINNDKCHSIINITWYFLYIYPISETYYLLFICKNSAKPCILDINVN